MTECETVSEHLIGPWQ